MRQDEYGNPCPATLGEYRTMCAAIGGESCSAVRLLDDKIASSPQGVDEEVIATDDQMRMMLMPLLFGWMGGLLE
jgi:hypothetical protein